LALYVSLRRKALPAVARIYSQPPDNALEHGKKSGEVEYCNDMLFHPKSPIILIKIAM
jgi:hypothetical protein